jgi:hypothetical protein
LDLGFLFLVLGSAAAQDGEYLADHFGIVAGDLMLLANILLFRVHLFDLGIDRLEPLNGVL